MCEISCSWTAAQELDHFAEVFTPGLLGGFHVHEFAHDLQRLLGSVLTKELELRGYREPLFFLLLGGHAGVEHRTLRLFGLALFHVLKSSPFR